MTKHQHVLTQHCAFCGGNAVVIGSNIIRVDCGACGKYEFTPTASEVVTHWDRSDAEWMAIAYQVRKMASRSEPPRITSEILENLKIIKRLPDPPTIIDDFVLWMGSQSEFPGQPFDIDYQDHRVLLGAPNYESYNYMVSCIDANSWFNGMTSQSLNGPRSIANCVLTPQGWQRYRHLLSESSVSKFGFMAMKFGDAELDEIFRDHFMPAVASTGFELRRLDQGQRAGLIDDQLRVALRTARFVVVDLTHGNRGAYWEAGFAEGLGRPVIYTCDANVFNDKNHANNPHFDTNHLVTVLWDRSNPKDAARRLKDIIRATLPTESKLQDDE